MNVVPNLTFLLKLKVNIDNIVGFCFSVTFYLFYFVLIITFHVKKKYVHIVFYFYKKLFIRECFEILMTLCLTYRFLLSSINCIIQVMFLILHLELNS